MAYDEDLADRIRVAIGAEPGLVEKRMFGGLAFLVNGNMSVAASGQGGILMRADPEGVDGYLAEAGVSQAVMGGRQMTGWLRVEGEVLESDDALARWVEVGVGYARSLPPK